MHIRSWPVASLVLLLAACSRDAGNPAPPRVTGAANFPVQASTLVIPVIAPLAEIERGIERRTPHVLWRIDEKKQGCLKGRRLAGVKVTPDLSCRIVGQAARGRVELSGNGQHLRVTMPVAATVSVREVAGVAGETATGSAIITADLRLGMHGDWQPDGRADIAYRWRQPPGIDVLGQRITLTEQADEKLKPVIAQLERDLPAQLAKLDLRRHLDRVWRQAFTVIQLNERKPPAWMRVSPRRLGFGGYQVAGGDLRILLSAEAVTETFVGDRPADPAPTALPPPRPTVGRPGLRFFIPVVADYAQLEPVVERTLRKLAAKGITLTGIGPVDARFGKVTVYATAGNHLAIGVEARVKPRNALFGATRGEVWLTAVPQNEAGSQLVRATDVKFATRTDSSLVNSLVALFENPAVQATIAQGLSHDFAPDYEKVLIAARKAIGARQEGDFFLSTEVTRVANGRIVATGAGLFMPVQVEGQAQIRYRPR